MHGKAVTAIIAGLALFACAPADARAEPPSAPSPEGEVLSALHLFLTRGDTSVCLNPVMAHPSVFDDDWADTREELRENGVKHPSARQVKQFLIEEAYRYHWDGWGGARDTEDVPPALAREIAAAHADMARRTPKQRAGMRLRQEEMPADIRLEEGCYADLHAPAVRGDWAFVGMDMFSTGFLYALHRIDGRWQVVARRITWLN